MNLQQFAEIITEKEGKKKSLSIGQVKEVLKIILREFKGMTLIKIVALIKKQK